MADRSETVFGETLKEKTSEVQEIAWATRDLIFEVFPNVTEVVWIKEGNATYGTGVKKMKEHFLWLAGYTKRVSLGFYYGADLPDLNCLLEGEGKRMRHIKLRSVEDAEQPALCALPNNDRPISIRG